MLNAPPAPLTPPDCDLRDFPRMMVDVSRLMGSQFNATASRHPVAWMVGHKLWYRAWHQVPAASLPDDDEQLCHLAELGFDMRTWRKAKDVALRGWLRCSDGRLYHPMVAEVALEAWIEKLLQRLSSSAGNAKRYSHDFDPSPLNAAIDVAATLLDTLNPRSRAADKLKRRQSRPSTHDLPPGAVPPPTGSRPGVPAASQGTETGTGIDKKEANASLSPNGDAEGPDQYPEPFALAWKAYPHVKGRSSKPKALGYWRRLPASTRQALPAAAARYRREGREPGEDCGAPAMERWLRDGRFADWIAPDTTAAPLDERTLAKRLEHFRDTGEWKPAWGEKPRIAA